MNQGHFELRRLKKRRSQSDFWYLMIWMATDFARKSRMVNFSGNPQALAEQRKRLEPVLLYDVAMVQEQYTPEENDIDLRPKTDP